VVTVIKKRSQCYRKFLVSQDNVTDFALLWTLRHERETFRGRCSTPAEFAADMPISAVNYYANNVNNAYTIVRVTVFCVFISLENVYIFFSL